MKAITVRLPLDVWKACVHRFVDEGSGWQEKLEPILTRYANGEDVFALLEQGGGTPKTEKPRPKAR